MLGNPMLPSGKRPEPSSTPSRGSHPRRGFWAGKPTKRGTHQGNLPVGLQEGDHLNPATGEEEEEQTGIMAENARERQWREKKQLEKAQVNKPLPFGKAVT